MYNNVNQSQIPRTAIDQTHMIAGSIRFNGTLADPAWALDRLSILVLKIYHMREEATRASASAEHRQQCQSKLDLSQQGSMHGHPLLADT